MQVNARRLVTHGTTNRQSVFVFRMRHILCNEMTCDNTPLRVTVVNYDYRPHVLFSIAMTCVRAMRLYYTKYCIIMSTLFVRYLIHSFSGLLFRLQCRDLKYYIICERGPGTKPVSHSRFARRGCSIL